VPRFIAAVSGLACVAVEVLDGTECGSAHPQSATDPKSRDRSFIGIDVVGR